MKIIYANVKAVDTADAAGAFEAVISTEMVDRDGEIVAKGAFLPLPVSIPIHIDHEFTNVMKVVGRGEPFYDGDVLRVKGVFASTPEAQAVRTLVMEGMVQTMSVGFLFPQRETKNSVPVITKAELMEASFVSVPANTEARVVMAKAVEAEAKRGARNSVKDAQTIQSLHDIVCALGAECATKTTDAETSDATVTDPDVKAAADKAAADRLADVQVAKARRELLAGEAALALL